MADTCPKCGFAEVGSDRCPQCGVVIALYQASLEKLRRGPRAAARAMPSTPALAAPVAAPPPSAGMTAPAAARPTATDGVRRARFQGSVAAVCCDLVIRVSIT